MTYPADVDPVTLILEAFANRSLPELLGALNSERERFESDVSTVSTSADPASAATRRSVYPAPAVPDWWSAPPVT